jgi:hypothetical protein
MHGSTFDRRRLSIYLNDHLAGSVVGLGLAKRASASNRGNRLGALLAQLVQEIEDDQATLREIMRSLGLRERRYKQLLGFALERVGRLKLNGQVTGYSPLSRLVELETLSLGIEGKLSGWLTLSQAAGGHTIAGFDLDLLAARARRQREELERHRAWVATTALGAANHSDASNERAELLRPRQWTGN